MPPPKASSAAQLPGRPPDESERPVLPVLTAGDVSPAALGPLVPPAGEDAIIGSPGVSPHPATVTPLASASPTAEGNVTPLLVMEWRQRLLPRLLAVRRALSAQLPWRWIWILRWRLQWLLMPSCLLRTLTIPARYAHLRRVKRLRFPPRLVRVLLPHHTQISALLALILHGLRRTIML